MCHRLKQRPIKYVLKYLILLIKLNMASSFIQSPRDVKLDCSPFLMCITPVAEIVKYSGSTSSRVVTSRSYGLNRTPTGALHHQSWNQESTGVCSHACALKASTSRLQHSPGLIATGLAWLTINGLPVAIEKFDGAVLPILGIKFDHIVPGADLWVGIQSAAGGDTGG